jgi:hypothetical protein
MTARDVRAEASLSGDQLKKLTANILQKEEKWRGNQPGFEDFKEEMTLVCQIFLF